MSQSNERKATPKEIKKPLAAVPLPAIYILSKNSPRFLNVQVELISLTSLTSISMSALLDSGATSMFINWSFMQKHPPPPPTCPCAQCRWLPKWEWISVRVWPCVLNSTLFQCISEALLHTLMHCILDSACYTILHCPLHLCLHMCHLHLLVCLFVSPSRLFPLIDGQWTSAKSNCTHSIRRGLGRILRSSLLLNSSPSTSRDYPLVD